MKCILLLILVCGFFASNIWALRCVTSDGLQADEVRRVVQKCMRKVTDADDAKNYDEYENFDAEYDARNEKDSERGGTGNSDGRNGNSRNNNRMNNYNNNYNPRQYNQYYDQHRPQMQTGGNYYEMNRRNDDRRDPLRGNPYQVASNDNYNFNRPGDSGSAINSQNKNNDNSTDKHERDHSCILQCFFHEMKMTNDDGFPDRNRMISVLTKPLRDKELRDFYIDSIHECFRMMSLDPKPHRDNCLHSKNLVVCLTERARINCIDWNAETVIF